MNAYETFLQAVVPRVGPNNAFDLGRDAHINAFQQLIEELGVPKERIQEVVQEHLKKTAQSILKMPVPSPIQKI